MLDENSQSKSMIQIINTLLTTTQSKSISIKTMQFWKNYKHVQSEIHHSIDIK